jgi:hypothetical protein
MIEEPERSSELNLDLFPFNFCVVIDGAMHDMARALLHHACMQLHLVISVQFRLWFA